ncbi:putative transcriptional regulator, CopG family [Hydrogenobaculum sp. Y04AAS1]|uniref:nickel-responsive transcriptional regulator NikR n=1 Tax=Hydrogenobaculum sp. (strain Y04AAS1) TaxID=380749 RepID=UPI00015BCBC7|nr:putative transcriptional regulator, CopG family [Hydrogenobaculum sp. Y04AAS1]HCT66925.1 nickel-responsive transcriptional regulator NikR [Hydrogenobaculum sp.]
MRKMDKAKVERICITIPKELVDFIDKKVEQSYASRSEFIRDLIREAIVEDEWEDENNELIGVLVIIYDHHKRELTQKLLDIQHNHYINILCTTHIHIDHNNCLETIMIKGPSQTIVETVNIIAGLNGVKFAKLVKASKL